MLNENKVSGITLLRNAILHKTKSSDRTAESSRIYDIHMKNDFAGIFTECVSVQLKLSQFVSLSDTRMRSLLQNMYQL